MSIIPGSLRGREAGVVRFNRGKRIGNYTLERYDS